MNVRLNFISYSGCGLCVVRTGSIHSLSKNYPADPTTTLCPLTGLGTGPGPVLGSKKSGAQIPHQPPCGHSAAVTWGKEPVCCQLWPGCAQPVSGLVLSFGILAGACGVSESEYSSASRVGGADSPSGRRQRLTPHSASVC